MTSDSSGDRSTVVINKKTSGVNRMTDELSNLMKTMTKQVVRDRRKLQLPVEIVDEHTISSIIK
jgi:hypothetical protein